MRSENPVYLDYHATTPVDPRVFREMKKYFGEEFGNPASKIHVYGWRAEAAIEKARDQIRTSLGAAQNDRIIFTSGATESNNLALQGIMNAYRGRGNHLVTCATEHSSVLETAGFLQKQGLSITVIPVRKTGHVDLDLLRESISTQTVMISFMAANNEIGTLHPLTEIGAIAREKGVFFHTDAAQACGKTDMDVRKSGIDLLSLSSHKVYGPKGAGALYIGSEKIRLQPLFYGGGHENGLRSGTVAVPAVVGMGSALALADSLREQESRRLYRLKNILLSIFRTNIPELVMNGDEEKRLAGNLNFRIPGVLAADLIRSVKGVSFSTGSACASGSSHVSPVLKALGLSDMEARSSIRLGLGRFTTRKEVEKVAELLSDAVLNTRK